VPGERGSPVRCTRRRPAAGWTGTGGLPLLLCLLLLQPPGALQGQRPPGERPHFEGEHGLWVTGGEDELEIRWMTRQPAPGFLTAVAGGDTVAEATTRSSLFHSARVAAPGQGTVTLRYGAEGDTADTHLTRIRLPLPPPRADGVLEDVDSLYVVGDVHGEFGTLRTILRNAGLVDAEGHWAGGDRHLVLLGDMMDRGPDVTRTLWFLYGLEGQAEAAGGGVHVVLGNHEVMVLAGDLRYVSPKERMLADLHGVAYPRLFDVRESVLGQWLATRPAALVADGVLMAHGGIGPDYGNWSVRAVNDSLAAYMGEDLFLRWSDSTVEVAPMDSAALHRRIDFFHGPGSVFWYRGYLQPGAGGGEWAGDGAADSAAARRGSARTGEDSAGVPADSARAPARILEEILDAHDASVHVVAHTPLDRIQERFRGKLIGVDLRRPATEMLLLVRRREGEGWDRHRIGLDGEVEPLEEAAGSDRGPGVGPRR